MTARGEFERYTFETGPMENNVYLLVTPQTREAVLIDASDDAERIAGEVAKLRARVRMILLTHGHSDHWGALGQLRDTWGVPVGIHLADADMLPLTPNFALDDSQRIGLGSGEIHVLVDIAGKHVEHRSVLLRRARFAAPQQVSQVTNIPA